MTVVLFAGQGSQSQGMLSDFADETTVRQTFDQASDLLDVDLWAMTQSDDPRLHQTQFTQPALLTASTAIWRLLNVKPSYVAGHSLGEYSALVAADVLQFADAVRLVHLRGKLMAEAVAGVDTKMAAVLGLDDDAVLALCAQTGVDAANFNSQGQVVVAGRAHLVDDLIEKVKALGKRAMPLAVSVPSHCRLMDGAVESLARLINDTEFSEPKIAVVQNRHACVHQSIADIKRDLIEQLNNPVLWQQTMAFLADKCTSAIECGAGTVLTGLAKRQTKPMQVLPTDTSARLSVAQDFLHNKGMA